MTPYYNKDFKFNKFTIKASKVQDDFRITFANESECIQINNATNISSIVVHNA